MATVTPLWARVNDFIMADQEQEDLGPSLLVICCGCTRNAFNLGIARVGRRM